VSSYSVKVINSAVV